MTGDAFFATADGERFPITQQCTIGRSPEVDISFAVANLSRSHARVSLRSGGYWLQDLDSKNGTFVNGETLTGAAVHLADGDEVVFGGAIAVIFHDPSATPIAPRIGRLDGVWIDPSTKAVWVDAVRIEPPLSEKQLALLLMLDEARGEIVTRVAIIADVWADDAAVGVSDDAVGALVKRLRARLREGPLRREYVEVVKGRGIRLM